MCLNVENMNISVLLQCYFVTETLGGKVYTQTVSWWPIVATVQNQVLGTSHTRMN